MKRFLLVIAAFVLLLAAMGCSHLALFLNIPGLSFEQVKRSLRLFATEVMPRFAMPTDESHSRQDAIAK